MEVPGQPVTTHIKCLLPFYQGDDPAGHIRFTLEGTHPDMTVQRFVRHGLMMRRFKHSQEAIEVTT